MESNNEHVRQTASAKSKRQEKAEALERARQWATATKKTTRTAPARNQHYQAASPKRKGHEKEEARERARQWSAARKKSKKQQNEEARERARRWASARKKTTTTPPSRVDHHLDKGVDDLVKNLENISVKGKEHDPNGLKPRKRVVPGRPHSTSKISNDKKTSRKTAPERDESSEEEEDEIGCDENGYNRDADLGESNDSNSVTSITHSKGSRDHRPKAQEKNIDTSYSFSFELHSRVNLAADRKLREEREAAVRKSREEAAAAAAERNKKAEEAAAEKKRKEEAAAEKERKAKEAARKAEEQCRSKEQADAVEKVLQAKDSIYAHYKVLGLTPSAHHRVLGADQYAHIGTADIKKAYKRNALKLHPDKNRVAGAEDAFKAINTAYQVLTSERAEYDRECQEQIRRRRPTAAPRPSPCQFSPGSSPFNTIPIGTVVILHSGFRHLHGIRGSIVAFLPLTKQYQIQLGVFGGGTINADPDMVFQNATVMTRWFTRLANYGVSSVTVNSYHEDDDIYQVSYQHYGTQRMDRLHSSEIIIPNGTVVCLKGLGRKARYNDKYGKIVNWVERRDQYSGNDKSFYTVQLSAEKIINAKVANVRL